MAIPITGTQSPLEAYRPGQLIHGQMSEVVESKIVDETNGIAAGVAVTRGTDPATNVKIVEAADEVGATGAVDLVGFVLEDPTQTLGNFTGDTALTPRVHADGDAVAVLRRGRVPVTSELAAVAGDQVYVRVDTGAVTNADDGANTLLATGWTYRTATEAGTLVAEIERR
jgi:hypothetical protein